MNMTRFYRIILILAVLTAPFAACHAADGAEAMLGALRAKIAKAPAVDAVFTIKAGSEPVQGSVSMAGSAFTMTTPQLSVWFDGKTQWTMMTASQEVNISEPEKSELMVTNPFAILTAHRDFYTARQLSDVAASRRVELRPRDKGLGIERYVILIDKKTGWPDALVIHFDDGRKVDVVIDRIGVAKAKPAKTFVYDAARYPAMEIVDLR